MDPETGHRDMYSQAEEAHRAVEQHESNFSYEVDMHRKQRLSEMYAKQIEGKNIMVDQIGHKALFWLERLAENRAYDRVRKSDAKLAELRDQSHGEAFELERQHDELIAKVAAALAELSQFEKEKLGMAEDQADQEAEVA